MNTLDMSQYLDVFLDEGREQLALLESNVLQMERGDHSQEILQVIFRAAHTLKGSSRAMGFLAVGDLTHEMENVLDDLRQDKLSVSTPIVNALLDCLDALTTLVECIAANGSDTQAQGLDIPALVARLGVLRTGGQTPAADPPAAAKSVNCDSEKEESALPISSYEWTSLQDAQAAGLNLFHIRVVLNADCLMKSVRVFMVLGALEPLGAVLVSDPKEEALEAEEFDRAFQLLIASEHSQSEIEKALATISEIDSIVVAPWTIPGAAPACTASPTALSASLSISDYERTSLHDALAAGMRLFQIGIMLNADCLMKSVRVFMVLGALEPLGAVLVSDPKEEALEAEEFDRAFQLLIASEHSQSEIEKALATISEIERVTVAPWQESETKEGVIGSGVGAGSPSPSLPSRPSETHPVANQPAAKRPTAETRPPEETHPGPAGRPAAEAGNKPAAHAQTIRVDVARLDNLLNLIGELVIDRTQIARIGSDLQGRHPQDEGIAQLVEATHRVARITGELQDEIMKTRMLPIDGVFQRMPRMVRDLAQKTGKDVDFQMFGGETELDRSVLETLGDPLIHLLRNSVDHGIESPMEREAAGKPAQGKVTLSARHEENHIVIAIEDDGGGIDPVKIKAAAIKKNLLTPAQAEVMSERDAVHLIFAPGFSTAATVSDISGRGVGMDIVKSNLEKLGGRVLVDSRVGQGSRFTIHLPLTLAIVRALLVSAGGGTYVLPLGNVVEMLRLGTGEGEVARRSVGGQAMIVLRGRTMPLANLADVLCGDREATAIEHVPEDAYVVVVGWAEKQIGLCVDGLIGEQEVVIKSLGTLLGEIHGLAGATILGDGRVGLIVDPAKAIEYIGEMTGAVKLGAMK